MTTTTNHTHRLLFLNENRAIQLNEIDQFKMLASILLAAVSHNCFKLMFTATLILWQAPRLHEHVLADDNGMQNRHLHRIFSRTFDAMCIYIFWAVINSISASYHRIDIRINLLSATIYFNWFALMVPKQTHRNERSGFAAMKWKFFIRMPHNWLPHDKWKKNWETFDVSCIDRWMWFSSKYSSMISQFIWWKLLKN